MKSQPKILRAATMAAASLAINASPILLDAANEIALPRDTGGDLQSGVIYAANEARFTSTYYSEPLTAYTVGWKDPDDLQSLLEQARLAL